ncbi:Visual system homeobox 2 [Homalodisca vitripennis]|nr:Visual system homeobox 2 [Homalodisca vitripennis]
MHRKSLEAADQLKDDNTCTTSDKEEDDGDHQESTSSKSELSGPPSHNGDKGQEQDLRLPQDMGRTDPEQFRNNSIACLRAKAQEHSAKLLSLSADALMLVNNQLMRSRMQGVGMGNPCDANANSLHHLPVPMPGAGPEVASSDTSSSLF